MRRLTRLLLFVCFWGKFSMFCFWFVFFLLTVRHIRYVVIASASACWRFFLRYWFLQDSQKRLHYNLKFILVCCALCIFFTFENAGFESSFTIAGSFRVIGCCKIIQKVLNKRSYASYKHNWIVYWPDSDVFVELESVSFLPQLNSEWITDTIS